MIQNKIVFCIDENLNYVNGSIPIGRLNANNQNVDSIYVIAPFEIRNTIKVNVKDKLGRLDSFSRLLINVNDKVTVDELVNETKPYYEQVKDWNVWECNFLGKVLEFVSNRIASSVYLSFGVETRLPNFDRLVGYTFNGNEYDETLTEPLLVGNYRVIKNPNFTNDDVEYDFNDIILNNGAFVKIDSIYRKGNTNSIEMYIDPSVNNNNFEMIEPSLTDQIIQMINELNGRVDLDEDKIVDLINVLLSLEYNYLNHKNNMNNPHATNADNAMYDGNVTIKEKIETIDGDLEDAQDTILELSNYIVQLFNDKLNKSENPLKSVVINPLTYVMTFTHTNNSTTDIDLPVESMIINVVYDNVSKDLIITLQNGNVMNVPLDDLVAGLINEAPVDGKTYGRENATWVPIESGFIDSIDIILNPSDFTGLVANKVIGALGLGKIFYVTPSVNFATETEIRDNAIDFTNAEFVIQNVVNNQLIFTSIETPTNPIKVTVIIQGATYNLSGYAKLDSQNTFTQPQIIPEATEDDEAVNLGQVYTKTVSDNKYALKEQGEWITPTLINGWTHFPTAPLQYRKNQFGKVEFRGFISGGNASQAFIGNLPTNYRPHQNCGFMVSVSSSTFGQVLFSNLGSSTIYGTSTPNGCYFDGVSFYAE